MKTRKITELPVYAEPNEFVEVAVFDNQRRAQRVSIGKNTFHTEQEAVKRIRDIFAGGMKALILPYKE